MTATEVFDLDLPEAMREAIQDHARRSAPNEACGLILGDAPWAEGGRPLRWQPTRNALASPYRYEIHPDDLLRLTLAADSAGEVFWAIVHSHVGSLAEPSASDIRQAFYPDAIHVIVSLGAAATKPPGVQPDIRTWRLTNT